MTGQIPQAFIEDLLARTDIVEIIGGRVPLKRAGANYVACCPFHTEKTPSFSVNSSKQFYHCFGCNASGDVIQFLTEYEGLHFVEVIEELASRAGLTVPSEVKEKNHTANYKAIYDILAKAALFYQAELKKHAAATKAHHYLKARGFTGKIAKAFGLGFAPPGWDALVNHMGTDPAQLELLLSAGLVVKKEGGGFYDRFRDRILFPIRDRRGRVVGFGGRVIGKEGEPKYLNSPETAVFNKRNEVYGLFEARMGHRDLTQLLVVEGYLDVVSLAQYGIKNVVATLGTAFTDKHVEALFRQVNELIFCFDSDKAGKEAAKRALPLILPHMKEGRRVRFILLPEGEDPDSYVRKVGLDGFLQVIERATPLSEFLFESLSSHLDLHHLDSRAQLITLAKPLLKLLPAGVYQQMLYDRLAELAGIESTMIQGKPGNQKKNDGSKKSWKKPTALPPTTAIRAVAMLLRDRALISHTSDLNEFRQADTPGMDLLCATIEILRIDSTIAIERLREKLPPEVSSQFSSDEVIAIADHIPEMGIEQEFLGAIQRLRDRAEEQAMESLLIKAKTDMLSQDEKAYLKKLLDQREKNRVD